MTHRSGRQRRYTLWQGAVRMAVPAVTPAAKSGTQGFLTNSGGEPRILASALEFSLVVAAACPAALSGFCLSEFLLSLCIDSCTIRGQHRALVQSRARVPEAWKIVSAARLRTLQLTWFS
jgi:hypothetical protein